MKISKEKLLEAHKEHPKARGVLETLFPEVFEENAHYIRLGATFKRKAYPRNEYAVFAWNGEVRILNITHNCMWNSERNLKVRYLKNDTTLTVGEFKRLTGKNDLSEFIFSNATEAGKTLAKMMHTGRCSVGEYLILTSTLL